MRRIGILGGTFDPIHCGHVDLGGAAQAALDLGRLIVVPARVPPHRPQPLASSYHRFAMVASAVAGHAGWYASDMELQAEAPSYTADTLRRLHECGYAPSELFFVVGADAFVEIGSWMDYPDLLDGAHFAVVARPGCPVGDLPIRLPDLAPRMTRPPLAPSAAAGPKIILIDRPTADVSATAIRQRCARGESIAGLVPLGVQHHIEQHGLYTSTIPGQSCMDRAPGAPAGRLHGQS